MSYIDDAIEARARQITLLSRLCDGAPNTREALFTLVALVEEYLAAFDNITGDLATCERFKTADKTLRAAVAP